MQENVNEKWPIYLWLLDANFTLNENWYTGTLGNLHSWKAENSTITIGANAFHRPVFKNINVIVLLNSNFTIKPGALNGLHRLQALQVFNSNKYNHTIIGNLSDMLPGPVRRTLEIFNLDEYPNHETFTVCFGSERMSSLSFITITCEHQTGVHHLTPSNFSGLTVIRTLSLTECRIATIQKDTFDFIGHTLRYLILTSNQLTTISPILFRSIFEECTFAMRGETGCKPNKAVLTDKNPLRCDCDFYEFQTLLRTSLDQGNWYGLRSCIQDGRGSVTEDCRNLQGIDLKGICLKEEKLAHFHRKFQLNFIDDRITIRTEVDGWFRILLFTKDDGQEHQLVKRKCMPKMPSSKVKCFRSKSSATTISIDEFPGTDSMMIACVVYLNLRKQSWPLNCITIHLDRSAGTEITIWLILAVIAAIIDGIILIIYILQGRKIKIESRLVYLCV